MYEKYKESLINCPIFKKITIEEIYRMLYCLSPKIDKFKKNEFLSIAGDSLKGVGVILEGTAVVTKENVDGNRIMVNLLEQGDIFGEMAAFSGKKFWPATIIAQEDCTTIFLPANKIVGACEKACSGHKKLIMNMLNIISNKALMLNKKLEYLSLKNLRKRISTFLWEEYNKAGKTTFTIPFNRNELAEFLNVSRPSLSRELSRMKEEGIIDFHKSSIKILDLEILKEWV